MRRSAIVLSALVALVFAACQAPTGRQGPAGSPAGSQGQPSPSQPAVVVAGRAVAGPTCPVEPASPVPGMCEPRPVANAVLTVTDASGHEAAQAVTGADGSFSVRLAPGTYTLNPQPVTGLMGGAQPVTFTVAASGGPAALVVEYDTGIR